MTAIAAGARTVVHDPQASLLVPAIELHAATVAGRWGEVALVAERVAPGRLSTPHAAAERLSELAARAGLGWGRDPVIGYTSRPSSLTFHAGPVLTAEVLQLFTRVLLGRWDAVARVARHHARDRGPDDLEQALLRLRAELAASGAIAEQRDDLSALRSAPAAARVAHDAWCRLVTAPVGRQRPDCGAHRAPVRPPHP